MIGLTEKDETGHHEREGKQQKKIFFPWRKKKEKNGHC